MNRKVGKVAQTRPKGVLHVDLVVADQVDKPPTNARHRMRTWRVEVVRIAPTTGVGCIRHQVPRIFHRFPQQLFIRQTTTPRGQALARFQPQPLEQNHGVTRTHLVIGTHRRDGKRLRTPTSPDTQPGFATAQTPASETPKTDTLRMTIPESGAASLRVGANAMDDLLHAHRAPASPPLCPRVD
jgi:hypothetical protein